MSENEISPELQERIERNRQAALQKLENKRRQLAEESAKLQGPVNKVPAISNTTAAKPMPPNYFAKPSTYQKESTSNFYAKNSNPNIAGTSSNASRFTQLQTIAPSASQKNSATSLAKPTTVNKKTVTAVITDKNRFGISTPYDSKIIQIFQKYSTKSWNPVTKDWTFSLKDYGEICKELSALDDVNLIRLPEVLIDHLTKTSNNLSKTINLTERLPEEFVKGLYGFQKEGISFAINQGGKCLIADDMGLGKTIQAISIAMWYRDDWPILVTCPASLRFQWKECFLRWVKELRDDDVYVATKGTEILPPKQIIIISYELMVRLKHQLTTRFKMLILDESHYIKSDSTKRTEVAIGIARTCNRLILLSGTPALSKPIGKLITVINYNYC